MIFCIRKCLPRCFKEEVERKDEVSVKKQEECTQQPLSDFFNHRELAVLGSLAKRVRVIIDDKLPPTLHGTSRVTDGVPLAIVNQR